MSVRTALTLSLALAGAAAVGGAWASNAYPPALDAATLRRWLKQSTDLKADDVVAVSRTSLSAVSRRRPDVSGSVYALVRSEALDPAVFAQEGAASWVIEMEVACDTREARAGATQGYPQHNLQGAGGPIRPADPTWRRPAAGTQLESVVRAVCDPAFKGPLAAALDRADAAPRSAPRVAKAEPGAAQAQVLASSSPARAESARNTLAAAHAELDVRVVQAEVAGATIYRVVAGGFADDRQAAAFCRTTRAQGGQCFVRAAGR